MDRDRCFEGLDSPRLISGRIPDLGNGEGDLGMLAPEAECLRLPRRGRRPGRQPWPARPRGWPSSSGSRRARSPERRLQARRRGRPPLRGRDRARAGGSRGPGRMQRPAARARGPQPSRPGPRSERTRRSRGRSAARWQGPACRRPPRPRPPRARPSVPPELTAAGGRQRHGSLPSAPRSRRTGVLPGRALPGRSRRRRTAGARPGRPS